MDTILFNQTGGLPLTTNLLNVMQNAYALLQSFGNLAGNYTIISGCEETGNNVADGVVFINGEVLPFKGGPKLTKVRIIETDESKRFEDGNDKPLVFKRHVEFGTSSNDILWSDFKNIKNLILLNDDLSNLNTTLQTALNNIISLGTRVTTLENDPDDTVEPATQAEVNARQVTNKYVSPGTLPPTPIFEETIIMSGEISATGSKISHYKKTFSSSRLATGRYRINHSIGNTKYGVIGSGIDEGTLKVSIYERYASYCVVGLSDDSSLNDGKFSFQIFKTAQ